MVLTCFVQVPAGDLHPLQLQSVSQKPVLLYTLDPKHLVQPAGCHAAGLAVSSNSHPVLPP